MNQTDMGASDYNTDRCSDSDDYSYIHLQVLQHGDNIPVFISSLVIKLTHDKIWHPIHIKTLLPTLFSYCVFYSNYPGDRDQSVL